MIDKISTYATIFAAFGIGSILFSPAASASTYITSGAPTQYSLGDTLGTTYDQLKIGGASGTLIDGGAIVLNSLTFTTGVNATYPQVYTGQYSFTESMTVGLGTQQLTIPFNLSISYTDALTIVGGTTLSFVDGGSVWQIVVNGLTLGPQPNGGAISGNLTAQVTDPPVSQTPLPGALSLFASGLGAMGLFGVWKRRKNASGVSKALPQI